MNRPTLIPNPEELEAQLARLQSEINTISFYLEKLKADRTRLRQMLAYYSDNLRYLRKHLGVINMDQYRKLKENIRRCSFFLKNAENDIDQFEKNIEIANKKMNKLKEEIEAIQAYSARKVLQFPVKEKLDVNEQGRVEEEDRNGS